MKKILVFVFITFFLCPVQSQEHFSIENGKNKISIPFKLINNLVFFPINVNGVELNFILDSGAKETILFGLDERKEIDLNQVETIRFRGLGSNDDVAGLKSEHNVLNCKGFVSSHQTLYVILDQEFNLSSQFGIPVNGTIGYDFFKDNSVEINYEKQLLYVYRNDSKKLARLKKKKVSLPMKIENKKPYILSQLKMNDDFSTVKMLVDTGNSDALWIFQNDTLRLPDKKIEDYLGKGFSGEIEGYRGKIDQYSIAGFDFLKPIVAFPDSASLRHINRDSDRTGSVGAGVLKRFNVLFDYVNETIYLKKNHFFEDGFKYNLSGIVVKHAGLKWINGAGIFKNNKNSLDVTSETTLSGNLTSDLKYQFELKPIYKIANLRKNSAAEKSGLQLEDIIVSINKTSVQKFDLQQINTLLKSEDKKELTLEVERKGLVLNFSFHVEEEL